MRTSISECPSNFVRRGRWVLDDRVGLDISPGCDQEPRSERECNRDPGPVGYARTRGNQGNVQRPKGMAGLLCGSKGWLVA